MHAAHLAVEALIPFVQVRGEVEAQVKLAMAQSIQLEAELEQERVRGAHRMDEAESRRLHTEKSFQEALQCCEGLSAQLNSEQLEVKRFSNPPSSAFGSCSAVIFLIF